MAEERIKIGIIGLDTSHVTAFTELLHDPFAEHYVPGGQVVVAYPGGSDDFQLSRSRVGDYTRQLESTYGVKLVESPEAVAEQADAILLESVDGRVHRDQFERIASCGKPIFVDKPFALSSSDANAMMAFAQRHHTPVMSCSALRFSQALVDALSQLPLDQRMGIDAFGPMALEPTQPGLFWYGIHTVEVMYAALGPGCAQVSTTSNDHHDVIVGEWNDGRLGVIRGNRRGNYQFAALLHGTQASHYVDITGCGIPFYASLLQQILTYFRTGQSPIHRAETLEIVRFIEAANESRATGKTVRLVTEGALS